MRITAALLGCIVAGVAIGCAPQEPAESAADSTAAGSHMAATAQPGSDEDKIANAMRAAPDSIAGNATIMDWPATEGGEFRQLRAGTNGWTCYPSTPAPASAVGEDPMCLDPVFNQWAEAFLANRDPRITRVGFGYMFSGDRGASASDPRATDPATTPDWVVTGPHIMVVAPAAQYAGLPTTPSPGPWVMWSGTPFAHIMVPAR